MSSLGIHVTLITPTGVDANSVLDKPLWHWLALINVCLSIAVQVNMMWSMHSSWTLLEVSSEAKPVWECSMISSWLASVDGRRSSHHWQMKKKHRMSYRVSVGMSHDVTPSLYNASFTAVLIQIQKETWAPDGGVLCTAESPQVTSEWGRNVTWSYTVFVIDVIQDVTLCSWFILVSRLWMDNSLSYSQQEIRIHNMILIHTLAYPKLHSTIEV